MEQLEWFETPEVIQQHFANHPNETTRHLGVYLAEEVDRLRRILKTLENEADQVKAAPNVILSHGVNAVVYHPSQPTVIVAIADLSQCQGCGLYPYYCKCAIGYQPTKMVTFPTNSP